MSAVESAPRPRPSRRVTRLRLGLAGLLAALSLALVALLAVAWYYSNVLRDDALRVKVNEERMEFEIATFDGATVSLRPRAGEKPGDVWLSDGTYGLRWEGGYGQVSTIHERDSRHVIREFTPILGSPGVGTRARVEVDAFPDDPRVAFGLDFSDVSVQGDLGDFPAWYVPGERTTVAIVVHGKGGNRREALRLLPALHRLGLPALVVTYRGDAGAPPSPGGLYRYGETEWKDIESAAAYALSSGATDLVLVGYSMGGGIVMSFMETSTLASRVSAVILDSPMLDFGATITFRARQKGAPDIVTSLGKWIASWRFDVHWGALDYIGPAAALQAPILLFHGTADDDVPVATSDAFARARSDLVTYVRVEGAGHTREWNANPADYEAKVSEFLQRVVPR